MTTGPYSELLKFNEVRNAHVYRLNRDTGEVWYGVGDIFLVGRSAKARTNLTKNPYASWDVALNPGEVHRYIVWLLEPDYEKAVQLFIDSINENNEQMSEKISKNNKLLEAIEYRKELFCK